MMIKKCDKCPRLCAYLAENRAQNPSHFNGPVPPFGCDNPELLIVGLAPGRGTNRTGRPFTGDVAGELLYPTLVKYGWATGAFAAKADDTIVLKNVVLRMLLNVCLQKINQLGQKLIIVFLI